MMDLASAELSLAASRTFGVPFSIEALERILEGLLEAYRGGAVPPGSIRQPPNLGLDEAERREWFLRRFRMQAARAAQQTVYYGDLFSRLGLDPERLTWDDIARIPLTHKDPVRDRPFDFVCRDAQITFHTTTTGTTGKPTVTFFSAYEMQTSMLRNAIGNLEIGDLQPEDLVLICFSSRATLSNTNNASAIARVGAINIHAGQINPEIPLAMLTEEYHLPGKRNRIDQLAAYSSYLGEMVEAGLRLGYRPSDFALRRFDVGSEITSAGLINRAHKVIGSVPHYEGYGITETWPMGGQVCSQGHLHYGANTGLWEFINPETGQPAAPGEIASIVGTPLPPYREAMLVIRYDTQDMVRLLESEPECEQRGSPAVSHILGKKRLSVRHDGRWTFPREVVEALEAVDVVPLPARCGFWEVRGGVDVEVVVRRNAASARRAIGRSLETYGVPVRGLHLYEDRDELRRPLPWRCDLREITFITATPPHRMATRAPSQPRPRRRAAQLPSKRHRG